MNGWPVSRANVAASAATGTAVARSPSLARLHA